MACTMAMSDPSLGGMPTSGLPGTFLSAGASAPVRAGMFGRLGGDGSAGISDSSGFGLPQLSGDVVAAGTAQTRPERWLDGGKFKWTDGLALALGAIGDAFSGQHNTANFVNNSFQQRRQQKLAEQQRQQEWDDWQRKQMWERANPKPSTAQPYRFEDNAGNQWELGPDGQARLIFTDRAPKQLVANGQLITSTNPYANAAPLQINSLPQPGQIVDDPRISSQGGAGARTPQTFRR